MKYFQSATNDPLFWRVIMAIYGLPFFIAFVYGTINLSELCPDYWLYAIPVMLGALGVFLLYTAFLASDETVDKRTNALGDGGEIIGLIFLLAVVVLALPIWELLKHWRTKDPHN